MSMNKSMDQNRIWLLSDTVLHIHITGYLALVGVRTGPAQFALCTVQASLRELLLFSQLAQLFCATACCWLPVVEWRGWKIGKLFEKWELSASEATSKGLTTPWRIQNQRFWVELPSNPKKGKVGKKCGTYFTTPKRAKFYPVPPNHGFWLPFSTSFTTLVWLDSGQPCWTFSSWRWKITSPSEFFFRINSIFLKYRLIIFRRSLFVLPIS